MSRHDLYTMNMDRRKTTTIIGDLDISQETIEI